MNFVDNKTPGAGDLALSRYSTPQRFPRGMGTGKSRAVGLHSNSGAKVPLGLKLAYTAFVAVVVWNYWSAYGPADFLWFCNVGLLITTLGLWLESPLLVSMQALGVLFWQFLWQIDFFLQAMTGLHTVGAADYMFSSKVSLFVRCLSLSHLFLPYLLLWLLWRLGYDRRALWAQTLCAWAVLILSYALVESMDSAAGNVNKVFGLSDAGPQKLMAQPLWLAVLMIGIPLILYVPTHWLLQRLLANRGKVLETHPAALPIVQRG